MEKKYLPISCGKFNFLTTCSQLEDLLNHNYSDQALIDYFENNQLSIDIYTTDYYLEELYIYDLTTVNPLIFCILYDKFKVFQFFAHKYENLLYENQNLKFIFNHLQKQTPYTLSFNLNKTKFTQYIETETNYLKNREFNLTFKDIFEAVKNNKKDQIQKLINDEKELFLNWNNKEENSIACYIKDCDTLKTLLENGFVFKKGNQDKHLIKWLNHFKTSDEMINILTLLKNYNYNIEDFSPNTQNFFLWDFLESNFYFYQKIKHLLNFSFLNNQNQNIIEYFFTKYLKKISYNRQLLNELFIENRKTNFCSIETIKKFTTLFLNKETKKPSKIVQSFKQELEIHYLEDKIKKSTKTKSISI